MKILIIDDESVFADVLDIYFKRLGCDSDVAINGIDAQSYFSSKEYDLILSDYNLPDVMIFSLIENIKIKNPHAKIVIMGGFINENQKQLLKQKGIKHILEKPFSLCRLNNIYSATICHNHNEVSLC